MDQYIIEEVEVVTMTGEATWALGEDRQVRALDIYGPTTHFPGSKYEQPSGESRSVRRTLEHHYLRLHTHRGVTGIAGPLATEQVFLVL
ncbi:MAG: hypothetical protein HN368_15565, partial [Spirochaetales bacterium]|nr:hypothetical protein [Spirochaetales bacterium]